jgi:hypothetical protein
MRAAANSAKCFSLFTYLHSIITLKFEIRSNCVCRIGGGSRTTGLCTRRQLSWNVVCKILNVALCCAARCFVTRCEGPRCTAQLYCRQVTLCAYGEDDEPGGWCLREPKSKVFVSVCIKGMKWHCGRRCYKSAPGTPRGIWSSLFSKLLMMHSPPLKASQTHCRSYHHAPRTNLTLSQDSSTFPPLLLHVPNRLTTFPSHTVPSPAYI